MSDNGGSAFPSSFENSSHPNWHSAPGMTLRDYFAAHALAGYVAAHAHSESNGPPAPADASAYAYRMADAMIEARTVSP